MLTADSADCFYTYAGSLVYKLGWLPLWGALKEQEPALRTEFLAVALHPKDSLRNRIGEPVSGPGLVQIWAVPSTQAAWRCLEGLPACVMMLLHQGRIAWDLQWCPDSQQLLEQHAQAAGGGPGAATVQALGVVAVVLGDGSTQVSKPPLPGCLFQHSKNMIHGSYMSG